MDKKDFKELDAVGLRDYYKIRERKISQIPCRRDGIRLQLNGGQV